MCGRVYKGTLHKGFNSKAPKKTSVSRDIFRCVHEHFLTFYLWLVFTEIRQYQFEMKAFKFFCGLRQEFVAILKAK